MKLSSVLTALLVSISLLAVPACKKDKAKADDKAGEAAPAEKPTEPPAGGEAKVEPATATGDEATAEPAAAGEPTEVKKDEAAAAGGEKKDDKGGW